LTSSGILSHFWVSNGVYENLSFSGCCAILQISRNHPLLAILLVTSEVVMQFVECTYQDHAASILDIFNEAIANTTALYAYHPRTMEFMEEWFRIKAAGRFPVIGALGDRGELTGFASYGQFRSWAAYKYTVENSVYVHRDHRGQGIGLILMQQLIEKALAQDYHVMIAGIDEENRGSIALHEKLGFFHSGTIRHAGYKFGQWRDLAFYQLVLSTPAHPVEG